ncbi:DUF11 domain-containing protein [Kitasatospora azatica]|uniref:DUF11 domain-containing protein n=1 Tax=Kitasatospora azatica TaxID=58347 RepID=UPI000B055B02|nr:DUF11 domain-containing protein [Kitasatospora azatica]
MSAVLVLCAVGALTAAGPAPSGADLQVVPLDPDPVAAGGSTTVHAFVANGGPEVAGAFTVTVRVPVGARAVGPYFPAGCVASEAGRVVRCAFPAGLPQLRSATALVPVRVADWASGTLYGGWVTVRSDDDPDRSNNTGSFVIRVAGSD